MDTFPYMYLESALMEDSCPLCNELEGRVSTVPGLETKCEDKDWGRDGMATSNSQEKLQLIVYMALH